LFYNNFEGSYFFVPLLTKERWGSYGMAGGCFTHVVLSSSQNYHQVHATEPCRLPKDVVAAWGAVILLFHRASNVH